MELTDTERQQRSADRMQQLASLRTPPTFADPRADRQHRKERLAAAFRLFSKFGFDDGVAGHITVRDPEHEDSFWVNPLGVHFSQIRVSNLIRCNHNGDVVEGNQAVNEAAFAIHSSIHKARPQANAAAHSHSIYGRAWSAFGQPLDPITQDACAFYDDHSVYTDFGGVAVEEAEGARIARALGGHKAVILQNHGLLTVGDTVDEAAFWFIKMERACQIQLLVESAAANGRKVNLVRTEMARQSARLIGTSAAGWYEFQPLYARIVAEQPDLLS